MKIILTGTVISVTMNGPEQNTKGCSNNFALGKVIRALSQDLTVTVCRPTSIQSPSISKEGIVTQSPSLIVSDPKT